MGMDGPAFESWFADELKTNRDFAVRWQEHEAYYERHKEFLRRTFLHQGAGDWNLFKLFIERDLTLVRQGGRFSLLVPSGFQTDEGCADLRRWLITEHRLEELTSFENRGYTSVENGEEETRQIFPMWTAVSNSASSRWSRALPRPRATPSTPGFISTIRWMPLPRPYSIVWRCWNGSRLDSFL